MEVLGIRAQADARVVEQEAPRLLAERDRERGARRHSSGHDRLLRGKGEIERAVELRSQLPGPGRACPAKLLHESPEGPLLAADELHLELAEPSRDPLPGEQGDGVVDHLGTVDEHDLTPRAESRHGSEVAAPEERDE